MDKNNNNFENLVFAELDKLAAKNKITLFREYGIKGKLSTYNIDFYFPYIKLAIEADEAHHKYRLDQDGIRQQDIEDSSGCCFFRINTNIKLSKQIKELKIIIKHKIAVTVLVKNNTLNHRLKHLSALTR